MVMNTSGRIPREAIRNAVMLGLQRRGEPIDMITQARKYNGDKAQQNFRNKPVWHNKKKLDHFVAKTLKLDISTVLGSKRLSSNFSSAVAYEISRLRKKDLICDWDSSHNLGVWRLRPTSQTVGDLKMSIQDNSSTSTSLRHDDPPRSSNVRYMKRAFLHIMAHGRKDNTYKFALARAILDYCHSQSKYSAPNYEIPYTYLASRFLEYYWHQICVFKIKQDFHTKKTPKIIQVMREVFGNTTVGLFEKLDADDIKRAEKIIKHDLFGHARSKTSVVVPKFQNIIHGREVIENKIFYNYSDDDQVVRLRPDAFEFFTSNYHILLRVVFAEWAKYLERANTLPGLMTKIETINATRRPLINIRKQLAVHFDYCFYCCGKLEKGNIDVDHFIPWSYIVSDDMWNLTLACRQCNCKKSDSLANENFLDALIDRNVRYGDKIHSLGNSLYSLNRRENDWKLGISHYYRGCQEYGFATVSLP